LTIQLVELPTNICTNIFSIKGNMKANELTNPQVKVAEADSSASINLERYVPAYLIWIANKLSRGSSQHYLNLFGVGAEVWRCMVLLAIHDTVSAQQISQIIGMDKASVSRCFKQMSTKKLITLELEPNDGRIRLARLTVHGRDIHDQILGIALAREKELLAVLSASEQETLIDLLKRMHENLPQVEQATQLYISESLAKPERKIKTH
jgi:DNA-binding MarR family transcriptional regulator